MITVLGAGSWGTALAAVLVSNGYEVCIWGRNKSVLADLVNNNNNQKFLPNFKIFSDLSKVTVTDNLDSAINHKTKYIILAIPSNAFTQIILDLQQIFSRKKLTNITLISATKGLAQTDNLADPEPKWLNQIAENIMGSSQNYCQISGPSFAKEVVLQQPCALVLASKNITIAKQAAEIFHNSWFRVYTRTDILGVQLGGAVKNIIAFAVGCSDGAGFGSNTRAALITRGLHEMLNLGKIIGAEQDTLIGLSGLGDLVLSATDNQSRNKRFGSFIGQGLDQKAALQKIDQHVESIDTTRLIYVLAKKYGLDLPITEQAYNVLYNNLPVKQAIANLAARPQKAE